MLVVAFEVDVGLVVEGRCLGHFLSYIIFPELVVFWRDEDVRDDEFSPAIRSPAYFGGIVPVIEAAGFSH